MKVNIKQNGSSNIKVVFVILILTIIGATISLMLSDDPEERDSGSFTTAELSTLTCSGSEGEGAIRSVLNSYESEGENRAFAEADKQIDLGACEYNPNNVLYISSSDPGAFEEKYDPYFEKSCEELSNGQCIAIQPVFEEDELGENIVWSGYMLVRPETDSVESSYSGVFRLEKGLILDLN